MCTIRQCEIRIILFFDLSGLFIYLDYLVLYLDLDLSNTIPKLQHIFIFSFFNNKVFWTLIFDGNIKLIIK